MSKEAVLRAGLVPQESLDELARWGVDIPDIAPVHTSRREAIEDIQEELESREMVEVRVTELDALANFRKHARQGRLYYPQGVGKKTTFVDVDFLKNELGEYLIPWTDENIYDLMTDENTYLKPIGEERVYFSEVRELHYGERKYFMVCRAFVPGKVRS